MISHPFPGSTYTPGQVGGLLTPLLRKKSFHELQAQKAKHSEFFLGGNCVDDFNVYTV